MFSPGTRKVYLALVRPHLEYACEVWSPYTNKLKQRIEKVRGTELVLLREITAIDLV